jgi:hypothetical protein
MLCCVIFRILLFDMGMHKSLEEILIGAKWKWKLEWNISSLWWFNYFYIIIWSCMKFEDVLKKFPMLILEFFFDWFVSFGDMNNVLKCLMKFHPGPIIIKGFETSVLCLLWTTLRERRSNITMNPTRCFWLRSGVIFFVNISGDKYCNRTRCNGWTLHLVCGHP